MADRNLTITLPEGLVKEAKVAAAQRDTSLSSLVRDYLEDLVGGDQERELARERFLARARRGWDLGTDGEIRTKRGELHDRRL